MINAAGPGNVFMGASLARSVETLTSYSYYDVLSKLGSTRGRFISKAAGTQCTD